MTNLDHFAELWENTDEVITHSYQSDVKLPSGKTLALITLDNGKDHTRPSTLGPLTLKELAETLEQLELRATNGEIDAVAITGKPYFLAAGADLSKVGSIPSFHAGRLVVELGHYTLGKLGEFPVPTFVFINGLALGGGLEIALNANYRTVNEAAPAIALPEVFLGLLPGWGGAYLLPNLIGIRNALKVIIENPLRQNRMLNPNEAFDLGIADAIFPPQRFIEDSIVWADKVLSGMKVIRANKPNLFERLMIWGPAVSIAKKALKSKIGTVPLAPYAALELIDKAKFSSKQQGFKREDEELEKLIASDQFRASIYAFNLVQKHAKNPQGAPDPTLALKVQKVGIVGAGLMASQFALLFLRRLEVPVVITDVSQERVDKGLAYVRAELDKLVEKGRLSSDNRNRYSANLSGTLNIEDFANCDWVIEAVFEELAIKQEVFERVEAVVRDDAVLATNTSSLSIEKIGSKLRHPERLVGFHFFNPVAVMPLLEVVRSKLSNDSSIATAMKVAKDLKKTAVITSDSTGFVVNRLLGYLLGEAMRAVDEGASFEETAEAIAPLGLPMNPFDLLELVGLQVGAHVLDSMHAFAPDRFYKTNSLHALAAHGKIRTKDAKGNPTGYDQDAIKIISGGSKPRSKDQIFNQLIDGLTREIRLMLDEGVVQSAEDIDLCMILGAGWPFHLGGITPYLDRVGASTRVFGNTFHNLPIRGVRD
ncbi:MAG: 3-hydroxyacyl-CoA dehydrogenase NAD-binding domain-containing protein [Actinomycetota bacterium]